MPEAPDVRILNYLGIVVIYKAVDECVEVRKGRAGDDRRQK